MSRKNIDPRTYKTKKSITTALIKLLEENDFEKITIKDIADEAIINRATFYLHFNDKYDLLNVCIEQVISEMREGIIIKPNIYNFFEREMVPHPNFIHIFNTVKKHEDFFRILLVKEKNNLFKTSLLNIFHDLVIIGMNQFEPDDGNLNAPREIIIRIYEALFLEVIIWWIENDYKYSSNYMAKILLTTIIEGPYKNLPVEYNQRKFS